MKALTHTCKFLLGLEPPDTQVTAAELDLLINHSHNAQVIVEIGCYEGRTTAALALNTRGTVYSVDPFFAGRLGVSYGKLIAKMNCARQGAKNVEFIEGLSHEVADDFKHEIDFLFIDADHRYEAIKQDWSDWSPKVKQGGTIALHDSKQAINSPIYLGSMRFYDQDIPQLKAIKEVGGIDSLVLLQVVNKF